MLKEFPQILETRQTGYFPLVADGEVADICVDESDYPVVGITAAMLSDDVERVTGRKAEVHSASTLQDCSQQPAVIAGTIGHSALIDQLIEQGLIEADGIRGQWEASIIATVKHPDTQQPLLVVAGSDRRGTAFGLTSLSRAIGVSPWYWWADVAPAHKDQLYVQAGRYIEQGPSVL